MANEKIEKEFSDIIRKKMAEDEFWDWVRTWYSVDNILDATDGWTDDDMKETIEDYKNGDYGIQEEIARLKGYAKYVAEYPDNHDIKGSYPVCFSEWCDNEHKENNK